jgi:hypothetical protein
MDPREQEREKVREVALQRFFPGAVVVVARGVGHRSGCLIFLPVLKRI